MCLIHSDALYRQCLMEISVLSHVWWNVSQSELAFIHKFGCIEGFEDFGSHETTSNITKQALISMLSGL